jgi:hypothetical protein
MHGDKIYGVGKFHILPTEKRYVAAKMPQTGCDTTMSGTGWIRIRAVPKDQHDCTLGEHDPYS